MNEKVELKNVDKLCPIFGSHMIPIISKVPGVFGQQILGGDFKLLNCQKEKCQLWADGYNACSIELIPAAIDGANSQLMRIADKIEDWIRSQSRKEE